MYGNLIYQPHSHCDVNPTPVQLIADQLRQQRVFPNLLEGITDITIKIFNSRPTDT